MGCALSVVVVVSIGVLSVVTATETANARTTNKQSANTPFA